MTNTVAKLAKQAVNETQLMMIMEYQTFESALYKRFAQLVAEECIDLLTQYGLHGAEDVVTDINTMFGIDKQ